MAGVSVYHQPTTHPTCGQKTWALASTQATHHSLDGLAKAIFSLRSKMLSRKSLPVLSYLYSSHWNRGAALRPSVAGGHALERGCVAGAALARCFCSCLDPRKALSENGHTVWLSQWFCSSTPSSPWKWPEDWKLLWERTDLEEKH